MEYIRPKLPQMLQNLLSTQAQKIGISDEERLHWAYVVRDCTDRDSLAQDLYNDFGC